jgi:hypothetical protein
MKVNVRMFFIMERIKTIIGRQFGDLSLFFFLINASQSA